jgi:hypothetical protein
LWQALALQRKGKVVTERQSDTGQWACEAYGTDGLAVGALCFYAAQHKRNCISYIVCATRLAAEREQLYARMVELAANGMSDYAEMLKDISGPEELLRADSSSTSKLRP